MQALEPCSLQPVPHMHSRLQHEQYMHVQTIPQSVYQRLACTMQGHTGSLDIHQAAAEREAPLPALLIAVHIMHMRSQPPAMIAVHTCTSQYIPSQYGTCLAPMHNPPTHAVLLMCQDHLVPV